MDWLFRREVLTDQEIDLVKVMEIKQEAGRGDVPSIVFEIREHGKHTAVQITHEITEHGLGNDQIVNGSVLNRTHRENIPRGSADHSLGLISYSNDFTVHHIKSTGAGLVQDDSRSLRIDSCI